MSIKSKLEWKPSMVADSCNTICNLRKLRRENLELESSLGNNNEILSPKGEGVGIRIGDNL
jgi:hypothetical protein